MGSLLKYVSRNTSKDANPADRYSRYRCYRVSIFATLGDGLAENREPVRSHVVDKGASWCVVSNRLVCSLALPSCRHLELATCDSVPYGVWPPIAGVYCRACPTGAGQLGGSAYGSN